MSIDPNTLNVSMREELITFLRAYFDGTEHAFGGEAVEFPDCSVMLDRPQFDVSLGKPVIFLDTLEPRSLDRKASTAGMRQRFDIPMRFAVYTSDSKKSWKVNDQIQDCLGVVFNGAPAELGSVGIKTRAVGGPVKIHLDASQEWQVSYRIVTFRVALEYKRAGE